MKTEDNATITKNGAMKINWIPVAERMPEPDKPVMVVVQHQHGRHWARARWIPKHHKEDGEYEGDLDWSDDGMHAYWPEGWYEWNEQEEIHWAIGPHSATVTHWAEIALPELEPTP